MRLHGAVSLVTVDRAPDWDVEHVKLLQYGGWTGSMTHRVCQ